MGPCEDSFQRPHLQPWARSIVSAATTPTHNGPMRGIASEHASCHGPARAHRREVYNVEWTRARILSRSRNVSHRPTGQSRQQCLQHTAGPCDGLRQREACCRGPARIHRHNATHSAWAHTIILSAGAISAMGPCDGLRGREACCHGPARIHRHNATHSAWAHTIILSAGALSAMGPCDKSHHGAYTLVRACSSSSAAEYWLTAWH
jgi:hypothetical protein